MKAQASGSSRVFDQYRAPAGLGQVAVIGVERDRFGGAQHGEVQTGKEGDETAAATYADVADGEARPDKTRGKPPIHRHMASTWSPHCLGTVHVLVSRSLVGGCHGNATAPPRPGCVELVRGRSGSGGRSNPAASITRRDTLSADG